MSRASLAFRLSLGLPVLLASVAAAPAGAATLTPYTSEGAWLEALPGSPVIEGFDGWDEETVLTTQITGLSFSSPNAEYEGYDPIQTHDYEFAASLPNVLTGGGVPGPSGTLQTIVIDFSPAITALAFQLGAYHPEATPLSVFFEFTDESTALANVTNDSEDETANVFFGAIADKPIFRVTITSGTESGGYEEFVLDDLAWLSEEDGDDVTLPVCTGTPVDIEGGLFIAGSATDAGEGDSGIATVVLAPESTNLDLVVDPEFETGATTVPFSVFLTEADMDASGSVVATDVAGNSCRIPIDFRALPAGPLSGEVLCSGEGILLSVSNDSVTGPGTAACTATLPQPTDPIYPPGYEPSPEADLTPCRVLTIDSPVAGSTDMVYKKDGTFDPRLRLLFSRSDGMAFEPFSDITLAVEPILTVVPDPTRLTGRSQWSPVKIACALLAETCNGLDDDLDGAVDEGLPVGEPPVDTDGDGYPLCAVAGAAADCNDQIKPINPGATESCNGMDDDCDAAIDEGAPGSGDECAVAGVAGACAVGETACVDGALTCTQTVLPSAEVCDGRDNDCNGATDEDYVFSGYLAPVNADGSSIFRRRRAIPLKFRLNDCGGAVAPNAVATLQVFFYQRGIVGVEVEDVSSLAASNTGNRFRFDPASGQYIYNFDTLSLTPGNSYLLRTTLDDGTTHDVVISLL